MCTGPYHQQEPGKIPAAAHMGPSSPGISNPELQANQQSNQPNHYYLTPPIGSPQPSPLLLHIPLSHCPSW